MPGKVLPFRPLQTRAKGHQRPVGAVLAPGVGGTTPNGSPPHGASPGACGAGGTVVPMTGPSTWLSPEVAEWVAEQFGLTIADALPGRARGVGVTVGGLVDLAGEEGPDHDRIP